MNTQLLKKTEELVSQITKALRDITVKQYSESLAVLNNASIGQHLRHIIELFQEMDKGYKYGVINYEKRTRNRELEINPLVAIESLKAIPEYIKRSDIELELETDYCIMEKNPIIISTTYYREIIFNIEHTIHHMALIKIGLAESGISSANDFGVAPSTIKYRLSCAQ